MAGITLILLADLLNANFLYFRKLLTVYNDIKSKKKKVTFFLKVIPF